MSEWQPIETAPIGVGALYDQQIIVAFKGQFSWVMFFAYPNGAETKAHGYASPTHWMKRPAPPHD